MHLPALLAFSISAGLGVGFMDAMAAPANGPVGKSSYMDVKIEESFQETVKRREAEQAERSKRHKSLLDERYDLSDKPASGVAMTRGKKIQAGQRAKLKAGIDWEQLAKMPPEDIKQKGLFAAENRFFMSNLPRLWDWTLNHGTTQKIRGDVGNYRVKNLSEALVVKFRA